jgi:hypothetical protein
MQELLVRFGTTPHRRTLFLGLLDYRRELAALGFRWGFQWIDGSYLEAVELNERRDPRDIDVVTFAARPENIPDIALVAQGRPELFRPSLTKKKFGCDAYFVDLGMTTLAVHNQTAYWLGLFSHQRATNLWKGMLKIPLLSDDDEALQLLTP